MPAPLLTTKLFVPQPRPNLFQKWDKKIQRLGGCLDDRRVIDLSHLPPYVHLLSPSNHRRLSF